MALGRRYVQTHGKERVVRARMRRVYTGSRGKSKRGKGNGGWRAGNLAIRQADTDDAAKCSLTQPVHRVVRPNVSDDVADIANCKNYHRRTSPAVSAPDFLTRDAKPARARARHSRVFEFDTIAGNLDISFITRKRATPAMLLSSPSLSLVSSKTFLISIFA